MSELERYGLAAVAVVIVAVLLISMNNPEQTPGAKVPLPNGRSQARVLDANLSTPNAVNSGSRDSGGRDFGGRDSGAMAVDVSKGGLHDDRVLTVIPKKPESKVEELPAHQNMALSSEIPGTSVPKFHVIAKNETLSDISKRYLGKGSRWREFLATNPGLDPKKMMPGEKIQIPGQVAPAEKGTRIPGDSKKTKPLSGTDHLAANGAVPKTYTVRSGDTLQKISESFYGTTQRSGKIFQANRRILPNADSVKPGMILDIPPKS